MIVAPSGGCSYTPRQAEAWQARLAPGCLEAVLGSQPGKSRMGISSKVGQVEKVGQRVVREIEE